MEKKEIPEEVKRKYNERIDAIQRYYDISYIAAVYIYFRRKRSFPWKKKSDPKYLYWNAKLQNALIYADSIFGFDWEAMEYGKEEETLKSCGIDVSAQSNNLYRNKEVPTSIVDENGSEWQIVNRSKKNPDIAVLRSIGLLPH